MRASAGHAPQEDEAGLSLGTNEGDRLAFLCEARDRLASLPGVSVLAQASVYETEPVDVAAEHLHLLYLNTVIILHAPGMGARRLWEQTREIEAAMGRVRGSQHHAPRPIDIDILFVGRHRHDEADLVVPHPQWALRRFVLVPLSEVRPHLVLPDADRTTRDLNALLTDDPDVRLYVSDW